MMSGVVLTMRGRTGEVVLQARPYIIVPVESCRKRVCGNCFTVCQRGRLKTKCGGCGVCSQHVCSHNDECKRVVDRTRSASSTVTTSAGRAIPARTPYCVPS